MLFMLLCRPLQGSFRLMTLGVCRKAKIREIKSLEKQILEGDEVMLKLGDKLKLRKSFERLSTCAETSFNHKSDKESEIAILKNTVNAQYDKILELESKLSNPVRQCEEYDPMCKTDLKVSLYRERQAIFFLRQFRRFYRRVLKNKTMLGDISIQTLDDLSDVDDTLLKLGIIHENDIRYDDAPIPYMSNESREISKKVSDFIFKTFMSLILLNQ